MIVLDASVLIAHLDGAYPHHAKARSLLESSGDESLGASAITLAETFVAPARAGRLDEAQAALRRLGIDELAFAGGAPGQLAQLRADTRLKMPDCCVLLAARQHSAGVASFDDKLIDAAGKLGLKIIGSSGE